MKRVYLIVSLILGFVILFNIFFLHNLKQSQIQFQKDLLVKQTNVCGSYIERTISNYESELNRVIFKNISDFHLIFNDDEKMFRISRDLESLYAKYRQLISNIAVIDDNNSYLSIYINDADEYVLDTFARQKKNNLEQRDIVKKVNGNYYSYFPFFKNNELKGNIVIEINLEEFVDHTFDLYKIEDIQWQWILDSNGEIIYSNRKEFEPSDSRTIISDSLLDGKSGILEHEYTEKGKQSKIVSAYYPLDVILNDLGIVFSMNIGKFLDIFIKRYWLLGGISFFIIFLLVIYLIREFTSLKNKDSDTLKQLIELRMIVEHFPIGIMIIDQDGKIKNINGTGQKMLFVDRHEDIIGNDFKDQFLISNKFLLKEETGSFDSAHFIHYEKEGSEIVIYKRDEKTLIAGEEFTISALIDVSQLEKSRKQEAAANQAKSDFLAKMSHEIRTPMNGIIGMTDNLLRGKLSESQKEQAIIIKKSADLLMNIINDLLDFSKIEAGKMFLEEIPFRLSDDLNILLELFRPLAQKNGVEIKTIIDQRVPDKLIGDPFRLRQVISNLLNNAIKFTKEGEIVLSVKKMEKYHNRLTLLFSVEDTGIGISKEKISSIFSSYEQGENSTSRKYGGTGLGTTIAKQLVELMNGEIWVESPAHISNKKDFPGSKFSFTVELYSDEKVNKDFDFSSINHFSKVTALILSKKKDNTDKVHRVLESFGMNYVYKTYDDQTIDSVLFHIEQKRDLYQMIIIKDKPQYEGFSLAQQMKENGVSMKFPVIMISSNDKKGNYLKSKSLSIDHYLIKPYESSEIFQIAKELFPEVSEVESLGSNIHKVRKGLKILVAEDNIINQRVVQSIFKHLGYEIDLVKNGSEALKKIKENVYDVVFMDILMPEMDGFTATREIRKTNNDLSVIAMTASDEKEKKDEAFASGMNDYVSKPVKPEDIKHLLIKWFSESL